MRAHEAAAGIFESRQALNYATRLQNILDGLQHGPFQDARIRLGRMLAIADLRDPALVAISVLECARGNFRESVKALSSIKDKPRALTSALGDAGLKDYEIASRGPDMFVGTHLGAAMATLCGADLDPPETAEVWRGERVDRLAVLFRAGHGDVFLAGRYLFGLREKVGRVVAVIKTPELRLFETHAPGVEYVEESHTDAALARCDACTTGMRLLYQSGERFGAAKWIAAKAEKSPGFNVGIVWNGGVNHPRDHRRSIRIQQLGPLFTVPGVTWHSLQVGPKAAECPAGVIDHHKYIGDFADTARLIAGLDLVVSVDTAVANLAGSMGHAVWVLTENPCEWRWRGEGVPWFPTARVFQQDKAGDWAPVIERVRSELARAQRNL